MPGSKKRPPRSAAATGVYPTRVADRDGLRHAFPVDGTAVQKTTSQVVGGELGEGVGGGFFETG